MATISVPVKKHGSIIPAVCLETLYILVFPQGYLSSTLPGAGSMGALADNGAVQVVIKVLGDSFTA